MKDELREFAYETLETAKKNLRRSGQLANVLVCITKRGRFVGAMLDSVAPSFRPAFIKGVIVSQAPEGYRFVAIVGEAWTKTFDKRNAPANPLPPSKYEDREECVHISVKSATGRHFAVMQIIDRDQQGRPIFTREPLEHDSESPGAEVFSRLLEFV